MASSKPLRRILSKSRRPKFVLTGDSLTEYGADPALNGWSCLLQHKYVRSVDVINRGLSGYNTRWFKEYALPLLKDEWRASKCSIPSLITLWLGANDAALLSGDRKWQHVPLEEYKQNLLDIILTYQKIAPEAGIILLTPPPVVDEVRLQYFPKLDRSTEVVQQYVQICHQVATETQVEIIDVFEYFTMSKKDFAPFFTDGLHFTSEGNAIVYDLIEKKLMTTFPTLMKEATEWQLPDRIVFSTDE
jgi:lysophospholipase L1-like esterase